MPGLVRGTDGFVRCEWGDFSDLYRRYHDEEWGRPVHGDDAVFERLTLEAFQSGLSWITILRKREAFREAFSGFRIERVAGFEAGDVERLMADAGIVRNRAKVAAAIGNAKAAARLIERHGKGALDRLVWSTRDEQPDRAPANADEIPNSTAESIRLARSLKDAGFVFVGPTTAYAAMQAMGIVNDHLLGCAVRSVPLA